MMIGVKRASLTGKVTVSKGLANVQISCDQVTYYTDSMALKRDRNSEGTGDRGTARLSSACPALPGYLLNIQNKETELSLIN